MTLLIFYVLFTPIAYLSFGLVLLMMLVDFKKIRTKKLLNPLGSISDSYVAALVLASAALVIPAVLIGTQPNGTLQLPFLGSIFSFLVVFYLHGALSFSSLMYVNYLLLNNVILSRPTRNLNSLETTKPPTDILIIDIFNPVETARSVLKSSYVRKAASKSRLSTISLVGFLVLLELSLLSLILPPIRGYDALAMYYPEARVYFLTDQITKFDPLATRPTVKAPFIILLITWSWYLFGSIQIHLMPILFVLGTALIARQLVCLHEGSSSVKATKIKADLTFTGVLILPLTFWFLIDWPFYQDIYVGFFYASGLYWMWKAQALKEDRKKLLIFHILAALSIACALLSKINAWTIFIVLILVFPSNNKHLKRIKLLFLLGLLLFLSYKVSTTLYLGFVIVYITWGLILARNVMKEDHLLMQVFHSELMRDEDSTVKWIRYFNHQVLYLLTLVGGLLLGGHWLMRNFQLFPGAREDFVSRYLKIPDLSLIKLAPEFGPKLVSSSSYETIHGVSFHGIALLTLFGTLFVASWGIFKIVGLLKPEKYQKIVVWLGMYVIIWTTYYGPSSARYLSLIIVPVVILSVHGLDVVLRWMSEGTKDLGMLHQGKLLSFLVLAPLNYYYIPDLSLLLAFDDPNSRNKLGLSYLQSAMNYYLHVEYMLGLGLLGFIVVLAFVDASSFKKRLSTFLKFKEGSTASKMLSSTIEGGDRVPSFLPPILFMLLVIIPIIVPTSLFVASGGNLDAVADTMVLYHDSSYQQVIDYLRLHFNPTDGILSFNVPGIGAQTDMPTLEVMMIPPELPVEKRPWAANFPVTDVLSFLRSPLSLEDLQRYQSFFPDKFLTSFGFTYVVVPTPIYYWWRSFEVGYMQSSTLVALLDNPRYFALVLETENYYLFKMINDDVDFGGILDLQLVDDDNFKVSLLGPLSNLDSLTQNAAQFRELNLLVDFSGESYQIRGDQTMIVNTTLMLDDNSTIVLQGSKYLYQLDKPTTINLLDATFMLTLNKSALNIRRIVVEFTIIGDSNFHHEVVLEPRNGSVGKLPLFLADNRQFLAVGAMSEYFVISR